MKQSAAKTLGTAALGAAFAAAAAGSAAAAPAVPTLPDTLGTLSTVTKTLPVEQSIAALPSSAPEILAVGQEALSGLGASTMPAGEKADPVGSLLGGLPTGGALPSGSLPLAG
ncbi:ATP-binding protein [Streptomyces sp. H27-C3]|uniref:ATP-binding protein n=1 Tax=Streptomyces sp. H27-C3 TaxID=3046305 RepID=UPI0024BB6999|nr:ATP-binding protein [Streptomyces sp. H27-C3]MDJ0465074.1 ATP-binding protein [Streptomyces sp. H27-C3]